MFPIDSATKAIGIAQDVSDMDGEQGVLTLTGGGTVTLGVTVLTNDVKFIKKPTIIGETTVDLDAAGGVTNGVKFIWNAAADLPAGFKAGGVQVKVTVEK